MNQEAEKINSPFQYFWNLPDFEFKTGDKAVTEYKAGFVKQTQFLGQDYNFQIGKYALWTEDSKDIVLKRIVISIFPKQDKSPTEIYTLTDEDILEDIIAHPPFNRSLAINDLSPVNIAQFTNSQLLPKS